MAKDGFRMEFEGWKEVNRNFGKIVQSMRKDTQRLLLQACMIVECEAKRRCPVLIGTLRRDIESIVEQISTDIFEGRVGSNMNYAYYIEMGGSKQAPAGFLFISLKTKFNEVQKFLTQGWGRILSTYRG